MAILEHLMMLIKIGIESRISPEPDEAIEIYDMKQRRKLALLESLGIAEDQWKIV